jgi:hypothetical protein
MPDCPGRSSSGRRHGLDHYLVVHETARITEGGAPELVHLLAHVHLGPDVRFPPMDAPPPGFITRNMPERIGGIPKAADDAPRRIAVAGSSADRSSVQPR